MIVTSNILVYNEKCFQKVSFCVLMHPIGQNGRAVCKKNMVAMEMHLQGAL